MPNFNPTKDETPSVQGRGFQETDQNGQANSNKPARFLGTDNPRYLRILAALLARPQLREEIDTVAGASNGPDAILNIRDLFTDGLGKVKHLTCTRINFIDRDGKICKPGVYSLGEQARKLIYSWMARRNTQGGPHHV